MGTIFGDTDDITFGGDSHRESPKYSSRRNTSDISVSHNHLSKGGRNTIEGTLSRGNHRTPGSIKPPLMETKVIRLKNLVEMMKPSYLPQSDDSALRIIPFSPSDYPDPFFLIRRGDETLLLGTGFSLLENAGVSYSTFPDMRLPSNERDRIAGWILLSEGFDITLFSTLLEYLGFPFVYATREVIAYIRNNITDRDFLDKCRFFELFTSHLDERKIASFSLRSSSKGLVISHGNTGFIDTLHTGLSSSSYLSDFPELSRGDGDYTFSTSSFSPGEILEILGKSLKKNPLKFTFDTFFLDRESIGVVAGYTLKDRKELAENGVLTFVIEEDPRARAIVGHIFIDSRGFVHPYEMMSVHKEILKGIRHTYEQTILSQPRIDRGELVQVLRRELTKYCYLVTGRTPVVMPIIIER